MSQPECVTVMDWPNEWALRARMILAAGLLVVVATMFAGVLFAVFGWLAALAADNGYFPHGLVAAVGAGATVVFVVGIVIIEARYGDALVLRNIEATETTSEDYPTLHATVTRFAQQANLPKPTVAVAETTAPHAFTTGYTQEGATLVISTGLLNVLDEPELSAVVAHELAHIKNRDVAVMMAMSLPTVVSHAIMGGASNSMENASRSSKSSLGGIIGAVSFAVAGLFWIIGRTLFCVLSRYREHAADRGAVAITGSPSALASALSTLNETHADLPSEDLRESASIAAFSIVPFDFSETDNKAPVMLGPEGNHVPYQYDTTRPVIKTARRIFRTHPDTDTRIARLKTLQEELS